MTLAHAQTPIVSPEIHADKSVTFRFKAPSANNVKIWGEWDGQEHALVKDETGIWSVTLDSMAPDIYGYSFNVDGVATLDPRDTWTKSSRSATTSGIEIPGTPPVPYDRQANVAHGEVHLHPYDSNSLGKTRRLRVYTPAGYDDNRVTRFPILYLLHGSGDNEATWTEFGRERDFG